MSHIDVVLVEAESARRITLHLPRVPVVGELIVIGETTRHVDSVTFACAADGTFEFVWLRASVVPPDIDDVLEDS